ncbi:hypothetical protein E0Z10_g7883 [Xylaria hypoxylon]|uniref:Uncharacterized protein n=1 Tax=Xylaria hypoxylon TaxID=37992 RepID=A0A4Z0Y9N9_9PEZI|nr:hypothetical protein E0Z10_g7883 [Xylaria hypoxylon]
MVSARLILALLVGSAAATSIRDLEINEKVATKQMFPKCNADPQGCVCPKGTVFQSSTSYAMVYADTGDLTELISNFTNTAWFGTSPTKIFRGGSRHPTRLLIGDVEGVPVPTKEQLMVFTDYSGKSDQSKTTRFEDGFFMKFQVIDTPIKYSGSSGPGIIAGSWDIMDVRRIGEQQTMWVWSIYVCFSSAFPFNEFHESAMNNISSILGNQGKLSRDILGPFSV